MSRAPLRRARGAVNDNHRRDMLILPATILLETADEGGLAADGFSGMQLSLTVSDDRIVCRLRAGADGAPIPRGKRQVVTIELPYGERYADLIQPGFLFELAVGGKVVGHGRVDKPDLTLTTVEEFLALYEQEAASGDKGWRSRLLAEELCSELLARGFPAESLLLSKRVPVDTLRRLARR